MILSMKATGLIIIISILLSLSGPITLTTPAKQSTTSIVTLDVCRTGHLFSVSPQSPFIFEHTAALSVPEGISSVDGLTTLFMPFITTAGIDRPPQA